MGRMRLSRSRTHADFHHVEKFASCDMNEGFEVVIRGGCLLLTMAGGGRNGFSLSLSRPANCSELVDGRKYGLA